jgi:hypothetical protein
MTDAPIEAKAALAYDPANPDTDVLKKTAQYLPNFQTWPGVYGVLTMQLASVADDIVPWGRSPWKRDQQLREFWPTENILAGALYSICARNAALDWKIDGPPRTAAAVQDMLHSANLGKGWIDFATRLTLDLATQDNGAFIELIREGDSPTAAVIGLNDLDAARCLRTGDPNVPVVYTDRIGYRHLMKWYQVVSITEMPSPIETMNGMQYSALTRILRAAQVLRDISVYQREKIGARGPTSIHLVSGVAQARIEDQINKEAEKGDNQGLMRYLQPTILASLDPAAGVTHVEIPIKSLPDGFDEDKALKWYISTLALGFGRDYQDFAPLPGGGLGTSNQSQILHEKSQGKGPALHIKILEHIFNFQGVLPSTCSWRVDEEDLATDLDKAKVRTEEAAETKIMIDSGVWTPKFVRQMQVDSGRITDEQLAMLGEDDATTDTTVTDETPAEDVTDIQQIDTAPDQVVVTPAAAAKSRRLSLAQIGQVLADEVRKTRKVLGG